MANGITLPLPQTRAFWRRWERPTWGVALAIYTAWATLLLNRGRVPWPIEALLAACILARDFLLQHEAIHGWRSLPGWLRTAIVWRAPIGGWWPFELYLRGHSRHHRNTRLT